MRLLVGICIAFGVLVNMNAIGQNLELGAGLGYGDHIKTPGFNIRALYKLKKKIDVGADFQFFLKNKSSDEFVNFNESRKDFNIISRYVFEEFDFLNSVRFYPIIGVGLVNIKTSGGSKFSDNTILKIDDTAKRYLGVLAGIGGKYELNTSIVFFGEIRYHYSKEPQTMLNAGIIYVITLPFLKNE